MGQQVLTLFFYSSEPVLRHENIKGLLRDAQIFYFLEAINFLVRGSPKKAFRRTAEDAWTPGSKPVQQAFLYLKFLSRILKKGEDDLILLIKSKQKRETQDDWSDTVRKKLKVMKHEMST